MAKVVFTEPAEYDLMDIEHYIFAELCNPQASERITEGILQSAEKLTDFPTKHPLLNDPLLNAVGLRMTRFDNYNTFYYYNKDVDVVYVIRILYNKADWQNILLQ